MAKTLKEHFFSPDFLGKPKSFNVQSEITLSKGEKVCLYLLIEDEVIADAGFLHENAESLIPYFSIILEAACGQEIGTYFEEAILQLKKVLNEDPDFEEFQNKNENFLYLACFDLIESCIDQYIAEVKSPVVSKKETVCHCFNLDWSDLFSKEGALLYGKNCGSCKDYINEKIKTAENTKNEFLTKSRFFWKRKFAVWTEKENLTLGLKNFSQGFFFIDQKVTEEVRELFEKRFGIHFYLVESREG